MAMIGRGTHLVRVKTVGLGSSPSGAEQASITFIDRNDDTITWYTSLGFLKGGGFSKKAFEYAANAFKAIGFDAESYGYDFSVLNGDVGADLAGGECEIVVEDEEYEGKVHTRVKWVNDLSGGGFRLDEGQAGNFQRKLRAALAQEGINVKAPAQRAPAPRPQPGTTSGYDPEDIPF